MQTMLAQEIPDGAGPLDVLNTAIGRLDILNYPDELLNGLANLHVVWASVLLVLGIMCILNGYKWHKWVIIACALMAGIGLGHVLSKQMGESRVVIGALALLCAVVATPMLRIAVAVFAGLTGAFIGANAWTAFSEAPDSHLAGAAIGFISLALISFILFRPTVVMFTSIGGAALAVLGGITLLLHVPSLSDAVRESLAANQRLIPLLVGTAAITGFVLQFGQAAEAKPAGKAAASAK